MRRRASLRLTDRRLTRTLIQATIPMSEVSKDLPLPLLAGEYDELGEDNAD